MLTERIKESIRLRFMLVFIGTLLLAGIFTFPAILISESQRVMTSIEGQLSLDASKNCRAEPADRAFAAGNCRPGPEQRCRHHGI